MYIAHLLGAGIHINGLVQDCSNSSVLGLELLQSCTKPSIWLYEINLPYHNIHLIWLVSFHNSRYAAVRQPETQAILRYPLITNPGILKWVL